MTVLLTGATGYLGSQLLRALKARGHKVVVLKRSFSDTFRIEDLLANCPCYDLDIEDLSAVFESYRFDAILHCATNYGRKTTDPLQSVEANIQLPLSLLEFGRKFGVHSFLNTDTILDKGANAYSLTKSHFKDWLNMYSPSLACCNVVLEQFYGPGDDRSKFVSSIIDSFLQKEPELQLTLGLQRRDFIFVEDVVEAILLILDASQKLPFGFHPFEIGTGNQLTIRHFVELVKKLVGNVETELLFGALPYRTNEVMTRNPDISAIAALGWTAKHSLIQGLKKTINEQQRAQVVRFGGLSRKDRGSPLGQ